MNAGHAIAGLLLLANLALLGLVGTQSRAGAFSAYRPASFMTLKEQINQERRRLSQASMTPTGQASSSPPDKSSPPSKRTARESEPLLAGIDGFVGTPCPALDSFLDFMEAGLAEAGGTPPEVDREELLVETSCTIDDPKVNRVLRRYRRAWVGAGLTPLATFRHLGKK